MLVYRCLPIDLAEGHLLTVPSSKGKVVMAEPRAWFCFVADYEKGLQYGPGRILCLVRAGTA